MLNAGESSSVLGSSWVQAQRDRHEAYRESVGESQVEGS
jgi:hypothetical protein